MELVEYPQKGMFERLSARPSMQANQVLSAVETIVDRVAEQGDQALVDFTQKFDGVRLAKLQVAQSAITNAHTEVAPDLKAAIATARRNIERYHEGQVQRSQPLEVMSGVKCWERHIALSPVGVYVPAGSAPLISSALMLLAPAKLAGCKDVIMCVPPDRDGKVHPAILYIASLFEGTKVFSVGGAQAIAAMAYGTNEVPQVRKIFGPGNQYVTTAKQIVSQRGQVAIDMPAGPSELVVWCDESAQPGFVAADLLSQAEHGADSQVFLVSESIGLVNEVLKEVESQLRTLPRAETARAALENSRALLLKDAAEALEFIDIYGPEHLIIARSDAASMAEQVVSAGSIFVGNFTPESAGDYASGTNHVLPTGGFARFLSGISVRSFCKTSSVQEISSEGLEALRSSIVTLAREEGLEGHARAVEIRLGK